MDNPLGVDFFDRFRESVDDCSRLRLRARCLAAIAEVVPEGALLRERHHQIDTIFVLEVVKHPDDALAAVDALQGRDLGFEKIDQGRVGLL